MNKDHFWKIIEATRVATTPEDQLDLFRKELVQLSPSEIVEFDLIFSELLFASYNWDLWLVAWLSDNHGCSDDNFLNFRSWLISRGQIIYETALQNPDSIADEISQLEHARFELFSYIPFEIYREKTGQNCPNNKLRHPSGPSGGDWLRSEYKNQKSDLLNRCVIFDELGDEDFEVVTKLFPKTWSLSIKRGIMTEK
jgi:hypothetical protein